MDTLNVQRLFVRVPTYNVTQFHNLYAITCHGVDTLNIQENEKGGNTAHKLVSLDKNVFRILTLYLLCLFWVGSWL